jgi:membrane-associated phospholipid phosphatase
MLFAITTQWKISIHSTAIAGAAVLALYLAQGIVWPLLISVPVVGWSRIHLRRHTVMQVIAGALLGASLVYITVTLYGF